MIQKISSKGSPRFGEAGGPATGWKTKLKASVLVVTMIILGIILVSTLSISLVAVQERKASMGENTSNQAYNKAEDGVEKVMQDILKDGHTAVNQLSNCSATTGRIESGGYVVELKKSDDTKVNCNTSTNISDIASVKSIGTAGGNQRAVEVAVAADSCARIKKISSPNTSTQLSCDIGCVIVRCGCVVGSPLLNVEKLAPSYLSKNEGCNATMGGYAYLNSIGPAHCSSSGSSATAMAIECVPPNWTW